MKFQGWYVLAALWVVGFVSQAFTNYGAGVINAVMARDLGLDRGSLGLGFTLFMLGQGVTGPAVAWSVNRHGARRVMIVGTLGIALGGIGLATLASQAWHYVLLFGVVVGVATGASGTIPIQTCATLWFERRRAVALAVVLTANSVGGFVVAPLLGWIILMAGGNWRAGWLFVAVAAVLVSLVSWRFVRNSPAEIGQLADGGPSDQPEAAVGKASAIHRSATDWPWRQAIRTPAMWFCILAAVGFNVPAFVFMAHVVPHLEDLGHSPLMGGAALGSLALSGALGKLAAGFLCDRFEPRLIWCWALCLAAGGVALAVVANSIALIYLFAAMIGFGYGASIVCWPAMVANYFGAGAFATTMGVQMVFKTILASMAPYLVGVSFDLHGSYALAFGVVSAFVLVSGLALLLARPPTPYSVYNLEVSS